MTEFSPKVQESVAKTRGTHLLAGNLIRQSQLGVPVQLQLLQDTMPWSLARKICLCQYKSPLAVSR